MITYGKEELIRILETCTGGDEDGSPMDQARAAMEWMATQGIDPKEFMEIAKSAGEAGVVTLKMAEMLDLRPKDAFAAVFSAGFEFGVRFQQDKEW